MALRAARPVPKHLAPLSMNVIMNLAPLAAFKVSHRSDRYVNKKEKRQFSYTHNYRYKSWLKKKKNKVITFILFH